MPHRGWCAGVATLSHGGSVLKPSCHRKDPPCAISSPPQLLAEVLRPATDDAPRPSITPATSLAGEARESPFASDVRRDSREHALGELDEPVRVSPLVVVPRDDLQLRSVHDGRERRIEDRRVRGLDDVGRDERLLAVAQNAGELADVGRAAKNALTSATDVGRSTSTVRSTSEPVGTGTRTAKPWSLPASAGTTRPIAFAAPVEVGTRLAAAARARR